MAEPAKKRSSSKRTPKPKPAEPSPVDGAIGFDAGPDFDPTADVPPAPSEGEGRSFMSGVLEDAGKTVGKAELADKLIYATGMLHDVKGADVMADLQMTRREAELVASGLHEWSKRSALVSQVFQPSPSMQFAIGWTTYGYRVWMQRRYNLAMLEMGAGQGAANLVGDIGAFEPQEQPTSSSWLDDTLASAEQAPAFPPAEPELKPYNPMGD